MGFAILSLHSETLLSEQTTPRKSQLSRKKTGKKAIFQDPHLPSCFLTSRPPSKKIRFMHSRRNFTTRKTQTFTLHIKKRKTRTTTLAVHVFVVQRMDNQSCTIKPKNARKKYHERGHPAVCIISPEIIFTKIQ